MISPKKFHDRWTSPFSRSMSSPKVFFVIIKISNWIKQLTLVIDKSYKSRYLWSRMLAKDLKFRLSKFPFSERFRFWTEKFRLFHFNQTSAGHPKTFLSIVLRYSPQRCPRDTSKSTPKGHWGQRKLSGDGWKSSCKKSHGKRQLLPKHSLVRQ